MSGKHKKRRRSSSREDREAEKLRKRIKQIEETLRRLDPEQRASSSTWDSRNSTSRNSPEKSNQGDTNLRETNKENNGANDAQGSTPNLTQTVYRESDTVSEVVEQSDTVDEVVVNISSQGDLFESVDELDEGILAKLGDDPTVSSLEDLVLHPQLATRWKVWLVKGLNQEQRDNVLKKYSRRGSVSLEAPKLNAEVLKAIPEMTQRRDEHFMQTQNTIGSALSALGEAITMLLSNKDEDIVKELLVEKLCDSGKILASVFHAESQARKAYITPALASIKPILDKALTDEFLYGSDLGERIKEASALEKLSQGLKPQRSFQKGTPGNWKSPPVRPKQVGGGQKYKFKAGMKFKQAPKEQPRMQNRGGYQGNNRGGYQGNNRGGYQNNWNTRTYNNNKNY